MWDEAIDEATLRRYLGGTGLGMKYLMEEVDPKLEWSDPKNIFFFGSGFWAAPEFRVTLPFLP